MRNGTVRASSMLVVIAAGFGAFVVARELARGEPGAAVVEAAERTGVAVVEPVDRIVVANRAPERRPHATADEAAARGSSSNPAASRPAFAREASSNPFQSMSWVAPAPVVPPAPPVPPQAPKAPPVPFIFVGLLSLGAAQPAAFLARGEDLFIASAGDVLDSKYRVDSLTQSEVVVTYLPLNERQAIALAGGGK